MLSWEDICSMKRIRQGEAPSHIPSATSPQSAAPVMTPSFFDGSAPSQAAVSTPLASVSAA